MYNIIWSPEASKDYWENIDFLLERWSENEAAGFIDIVDQYLKIIEKNPYTFQKTEYRNIHSAPVVSQITMFYQIIDNKTIELVRFWNNFKDPEVLSIS